MSAVSGGAACGCAGFHAINEEMCNHWIVASRVVLGCVWFRAVFSERVCRGGQFGG
jgi:hypothetical protein